MQFQVMPSSTFVWPMIQSHNQFVTFLLDVGPAEVDGTAGGASKADCAGKAGVCAPVDIPVICCILCAFAPECIKNMDIDIAMPTMASEFFFCVINSTPFNFVDCSSGS